MSKMYKVTEPKSNISMAATLIEPLQGLSDLHKIRVSNIYVGIDPDLNLINLSGQVIGQLRQLLTEHQLKVIPVLSLEDSAAIKPLAKLLKEKNSFDITLISMQPELIKQARELIPLIRGAVDYSHYDFSAVKNPLFFIVQQTNRAKAKIALLPAHLCSKKEVETLQKRLLTVWSVDYGACLSSAVAILTTGVNGIISHNTAQMLQAMSLFEQPSLVRKPLIIGHRGIPSLLPENTLEGVIKAYQLGVDAIEYDIQLSKDKQIVLMHDHNVQRTTDGVGLIEEMTQAEIKILRIMNRETITDFSVPTLDQLFAQFADTQLIHFIEIKSHKKEIVRRLKTVIDKYHLNDR
ncbi:MAG TPA: glycerophosphodiester phosphodiesterase family protein, partial [Psychromonas sp.]